MSDLDASPGEVVVALVLWLILLGLVAWRVVA